MENKKIVKQEKPKIIEHVTNAPIQCTGGGSTSASASPLGCICPTNGQTQSTWGLLPGSSTLYGCR